MPSEAAVRTSPMRSIGIALLLAVVVALAHGPGLKNGFLNFDDPAMVIENDALQRGTWASLVGTFGRLCNDAYLPVYEAALHLDARLLGTEPRGFHGSSLVWHWLNGLLLLGLARRLGLREWCAVGVALAFLLHPVTVESVAWVSGRKDQVSLAFLVIALLLLMRAWRSGRTGSLIGSVVALSIAGLAKGSVVVAPFLGLLLWRLWTVREGEPKLRLRRWLMPWIASSTALVVLHTGLAREAGTTHELVPTPALDRLALGLEALSHYAQHTLAPYPLSIHYHLIPSRVLPWRIAAGAAALLLLLAMLVRFWRRPTIPSLGVAWWFLALLPFNNVFPRTSVALADRYLAIGLVGAALAMGNACAVSRAGRWLGLAALAVLAILTFQRTRQFLDTETVFQAVVRHDPENPVAWSQLAEHRLAQGRHDPAAEDEASRRFSKAIQVADQTRDVVQSLRAQTRLADLELRQARFAQAEPRFRSLEEQARSLGSSAEHAGLDPVVLRHNRAQAILGQGRDAEGRELLDSVLRERPGFGEATLSLALLDAAEGYALLSASEVSADGRALVDRAIAGLEGLCVRSEVETPVEQRARYELVRMLVRAPWRPDRLTAALRHERALARLAPRSSEAPLARALIAEEAGDQASAIVALTEAMERAPAEPKIRARLARTLRGVGENLRAVATLRAGLELDPTQEFLKLEMADLLIAQGTHHLLMQDRGKAGQAGAQALEFDPKSAGARTLLGEVAESAGRYPEAETEFQRALEIEPAAADARRGLARCRQARGLGILADLKKQVEQAPAEERAAREQTLRDRALAEMRSAVELGGESDDIALARRYVQDQEAENRTSTVADLKEQARRAGRRGEPELALGFLESALRVQPDDPEIHLYMAQAERDLSRFAASQASAERALSFEPTSLSARKIAAEVAYIRGESAAARLHAEAFLQEVAKRADPSGLEPALQAMREILRLTER